MTARLPQSAVMISCFIAELTVELFAPPRGRVPFLGASCVGLSVPQSGPIYFKYDQHVQIMRAAVHAVPHNAEFPTSLLSLHDLISLNTVDRRNHHHHHHHHQFTGSKTRQSNTCNKANRAGQQGH